MLVAKKIDREKTIPGPTLRRLCKIYAILDELEALGETSISSKELGDKIGAMPNTVRKDISYLDRKNRAGTGYPIALLKTEISRRLGLQQERRACIVGMGRFGSVLMDFDRLPYYNIRIVAGFDSSINRLETIRTSIPVYPAHEMARIVESEKIELAIIAVPGHAAVETAENLIRAGIRGIVNFSSHVLNEKMNGVIIVNIDIPGDFRCLSAQLKR